MKIKFSGPNEVELEVTNINCFNFSIRAQKFEGDNYESIAFLNLQENNWTVYDFAGIKLGRFSGFNITCS